METNNSAIDLGNLQFYWRMTTGVNEPANVVQDFLPFTFTYDKSNRLIKQKNNQLVLDSLERIYKENFNVGYLQEGHSLAELYGNDFLTCIEESVKKYNPAAKNVREVGAGGCYILRRLQSKGFTVSAIDPSPVAIEKGKEFGIEVIADFYPTKDKVSNVDVYLHYDVLEHVEDPVGFLKHSLDELNAGGMVIFAVPDCTEYIKNGDISMILHEHINYYDADSLRLIATKAGFDVKEIQKANYGGVLYCIAQKPSTPVSVEQVEENDDKFLAFRDKHSHLVQTINAFIKENMSAGKSIGFYIPLRAIPYLSRLGLTKGIRFFDDDKGIHKKYFDGFPIAVENFEDLKNNPTDVVVIFSFAFGEKIKAKINEQLKGVKVRTIKEFSQV